MATEFRNEPLTDFSKKGNAAAMRTAIEKVRNELGREYPLIIGGETIQTENKFDSINPANRTQVVGKVQKATKGLSNRAVEAAFETFQTLGHVSAKKPPQLLFRLAA